MVLFQALDVFADTSLILNFICCFSCEQVVFITFSVLLRSYIVVSACLWSMVCECIGYNVCCFSAWLWTSLFVLSKHVSNHTLSVALCLVLFAFYLLLPMLG